MTKDQAAKFLSQVLSNIKATAQEHHSMQNALSILQVPNVAEVKNKPVEKTEEKSETVAG